MNLLMITRKIDADDWLTGHSYEWAKKISEQLAAGGGKLFVICLGKGNVAGLEGVEIHSLGKELGATRWQEFWRFQVLAFRLVRRCDGIFCHQNPEYAIAVWPAALIFGKSIVSWYTHKAVTWKTRAMLAASRRVLTASRESFRLASKKVKVLGHGIDTKKFQASSSKLQVPSFKFKIITVGRISPVKNLEALISAINILVNEKRLENIVLEIFGIAATSQDQGYLDSLQMLVKKANLEKFVSFKGAIPHSQIAGVYQSAELFVNLSATGSVDKAVLEAAACEVPVVTSNEAFFEMLKPFEELCLVKASAADVAEKLGRQIALSDSDRQALGANLRRIVVENHGLNRLAKEIVENIKL